MVLVKVMVQRSYHQLAELRQITVSCLQASFFAGEARNSDRHRVEHILTDSERDNAVTADVVTLIGATNPTVFASAGVFEWVASGFDWLGDEVDCVASHG